MFLFLNFDGVLHPKWLGQEGYFAFEDRLLEVLRAHPEVKIVLSTAWVEQYGFAKTRGFLHPDIQLRAIGATLSSDLDPFEWEAMTRYQQVARYAHRNRLNAWIAVDDDVDGWPVAQRHHLVQCDSRYGLSDKDVCAELLAKLGG